MGVIEGLYDSVTHFSVQGEIYCGQGRIAILLCSYFRIRYECQYGYCCNRYHIIMSDFVSSSIKAFEAYLQEGKFYDVKSEEKILLTERTKPYPVLLLF